MPAVYDLHEFAPDKIISGEIDPKKVVPIKYQPLPTNSVGMVIVDKNQDLTYLRKLTSLYTIKTRQTKFESIVDTTFTELEPIPQEPIPSVLSNVFTSVIENVADTSTSTAAAGPGLVL